MNDELIAKERALWAPDVGIGGLSGSECDVAFRRGWEAARAYGRAEYERLRQAFIKHRTATHEVAPNFCKTCQESDEILGAGQ